MTLYEPASILSMKRKADSNDGSQSSKRHQPTSGPATPRSNFRHDLFDDSTVSSYRNGYTASVPYPHAVVASLIDDTLLRNVRNEIKEHIHFTLKETDIYRIHQSGDLANLSNLDAESLKHLPNLVRLRDALYSPDFREWISEVTGAGKVSGRKTDMAVNVYTPGSYLLCHDDVIGSRRVSYILYLTDPDRPWEKEWGGGLRLYPTETKKNNIGENVKVPIAEHSLNIPPSFGQLSFFAVRPGESYHDVEEVYHANAGENGKEDDGGRIRMAISGWYHIPQEGEDGYEEGLEQAQAQQSSLAQLKGAANEFDEPQALFKHYDEPRIVMNSSATAQEVDPGDDTDPNSDILTEQDLTFLLQYIAPSYLTPQMIEQFASSFIDNSVLQLESFFHPKFAGELKAHLHIRAGSPSSLEPNWQIARPPHKHRYAYLQATESLHSSHSPTAQILTDLLHSHAFKKWLALVTGLQTNSLVRQNVLARRFRKGKDYALATPYTGEQPRLEFTIGMTPSDERREEAGADDNKEQKPGVNIDAEGNVNSANASDDPRDTTHEDVQVHISTSSHPDFGGEEIYMATEDDDSASHNGALPQTGNATRADPAVYKSSTAEGDEEEDSILFSDTPSWNTFSVVLRDKGVLRFVKFVSQAGRDRWDVKGEVELEEGVFDGVDAVEEEEWRGVGAEKQDEDDDNLDDDQFDSDPNHYFEDADEMSALAEVITEGEDDDDDEYNAK